MHDPRRRAAAARALGEFGERAAEAAPALVALLEEAPDGEGNRAVRRAVVRIAGREAARALPPNYDEQLMRLTRRLGELTKSRGCRGARLDIHGAREHFSYEWNDGHRLWVGFDRRRWTDEGLVSGRARLTGDGQDGAERSFVSREGFDRAVAFLLDGFCGS